MLLCGRCASFQPSVKLVVTSLDGTVTERSKCVLTQCYVGDRDPCLLSYENLLELVTIGARALGQRQAHEGAPAPVVVSSTELQ